MNIELYTDGSIIKNPGGAGGWACVVRVGDRQRILCDHEFDTTNNRMELMACIEGLRAFTPSKDIKLYSDAEYVVHGFTKGRVNKWARDNWMRKSGPVPNDDLWRQLSDRDLAHNVTWLHRRGQHGAPETLEGVDKHMAIAHQWALSEARMAHHASRLGWRTWIKPETLEDRTEFIERIAGMERIPDPPESHAPEAWGVYRLEELGSKKMKFISTPVGVYSMPDGGRQWCEDATMTMNQSDETEEMKKFRVQFRPRYIALQYSGPRLEEAS